LVRIGVAVEGGDGLDDVIASRFGRAPAFLIIDVDQTGNARVVKVIPNTALGMGGGVGVRISKLLADEGCQAVAGPAFGPNAAAILSTLGIKMLVVPPGMRVRDAIRLMLDQLAGRAPPYPPPPPSGPGRGFGRGFGRRRFRHGRQGPP